MAVLGLMNRYAWTLIDSAESRGYGVDSICQAIQLPERIVRERQPFDPETFARISRNIKLLMADEFAGLTAAPCRVGAFLQMCELSLGSRSLGEALARAFRHYRELNAGIDFDLHVHGDVAAVAMSVNQPDRERHHFMHEWWFIVWSRFAGWLIGEEVPVVSVEFPHAGAGALEDYAEAFSGLCRFSRPSAKLLLPKRYLDRPVVRVRDDLGSFMSLGSNGDGLGDVQRAFRSQVKAELRAHLDRYQSLPSIEDVAAAQHVSSQTLRRRLQADCTSYRLLKEEVRREAALKWLGQGALPVGEVSYRAGFSEANGLSRALKSWTGISPSAYRDQRRHAGLRMPLPR